MVCVSVDPISNKLSPITLTDMGQVVKITGSAFVAGKVPIRVWNFECFICKRLPSKWPQPVTKSWAVIFRAFLLTSEFSVLQIILVTEVLRHSCEHFYNEDEAY